LLEDRVVEAMPVENRFKRNPVTVMREVNPDHVEWGRVAGNVVWVVNENELRVRVDETTDQPGRGSPIDMDP
jgi:hypothetical protein